MQTRQNAILIRVQCRIGLQDVYILLRQLRKNSTKELQQFVKLTTICIQGKPPGSFSYILIAED